MYNATICFDYSRKDGLMAWTGFLVVFKAKFSVHPVLVHPSSPSRLHRCISHKCHVVQTSNMLKRPDGNSFSNLTLWSSCSIVSGHVRKLNLQCIHTTILIYSDDRVYSNGTLTGPLLYGCFPASQWPCLPLCVQLLKSTIYSDRIVQ